MQISHKNYIKILIKASSRDFSKELKKPDKNKNNKLILNLFKERIKSKENFNFKNKFKRHDFIVRSEFWDNSLTSENTNGTNNFINEEVLNDVLEEGNDFKHNRSQADNFFNTGIPANLPNNLNRGIDDRIEGDSGNDSSNSDNKEYKNDKLESDFSELYKKIRKEFEALKILTKDKFYSNLSTTNIYQMALKNRTSVVAVPSVNNIPVGPFLGGLVIILSLSFIIRLNRLNTLYRNPFFYLRDRIRNINNFRTIIPALKNFGLLPRDYIYNNRGPLFIQNILRLRNDYRNMIRMLLYLFGPVTGLWQFYKQLKKK